jgi:hypothetical protein
VTPTITVTLDCGCEYADPTNSATLGEPYPCFEHRGSDHRVVLVLSIGPQFGKRRRHLHAVPDTP